MLTLEARVDVVRHLRRLERASCAADIVKELQHLGPRLGPSPLLSAAALPSLAALAEAHLRDRLEPARDPLTGLLDARAFNELFQAHARHVASIGGEAIAIVLNLVGAADPRADRETAAHLKLLAAACTSSVAEGDYVGRVGSAALGVLPRHGGVRGARSVGTRLADACQTAFAEVKRPVGIAIELRDDTGEVREHAEIAVGAPPG